jgi:hypothetical protein
MIHNELPEYRIKQSKKFMEIADKTYKVLKIIIVEILTTH